MVKGSMEKIQLSSAQQRIMKWLGYGWEAETRHGAAVYVNGSRLCNIDTMTALTRKGLVEKIGHWNWRATEKGKSLTKRLCL